MGFALRASLWLFKFDPVKFVGSASQHKFIPDEFVIACPKKSNQKKRRPGRSCFAFRSLDEAQRNPGISSSIEQPRITEYVHVFCP